MKETLDPVVLDASAVLAVMHHEAGEGAVRRLLPVGGISAVNVAEVLARLARGGMPPNEAISAFQALHVRVLNFGDQHATASARYVRPGVSLGDRAFLATAYLANATGWTSDGPLFGLEDPFLPQLRNFRAPRP